MAARQSNPKMLIVEGHDDKHSVIGIMQHHMNWPDGVANAPVYIDVAGGADDILDPRYLRAEIKMSDLVAIGVMLDGDTRTNSRYLRLRSICSDQFPGMPAEMPSDGLVIANSRGLKFGAWIMPDNTSEGYLETFLSDCVPATGKRLWDHAVESVSSARSLGAACRETHLPKAHLYTWLAWQDPPGQSPALALTKRTLDPHCPTAAVFAAWFKALYL